MTCASVRIRPSCATLASSALSLFFIVSRSWRCQTPRTPAGEIEWPSFLISLATRIWPKAGCSQRKFNDPLRDLGRGPVRQDRLLAADLLQRQLAAFVIEILEAVEAIAAIAEHLAGLAHIAKLPGELQQAHLSFDNLLVLRHRRCPHKKPRPGAP